MVPRPALKLGFKNFPMDNFGVRKPAFRKIAGAAHKKYQQFRPEQIWGGSGSADATHGEPAVRVYTSLAAKVQGPDHGGGEVRGWRGRAYRHLCGRSSAGLRGTAYPDRDQR